MADFDPEEMQYGTRSTATRMPTVENTFRSFEEVENLQGYLDNWGAEHLRQDFNPVFTLTACAEIIESAVDDFMKMDPDPLDDRHPVRTHPHAAYGHLLKALFKRDEFMSKLIISYLSNRENVELCIAASRLLLACVPGLDSEVIFSEPEDFVPRLFEWARTSENETLQAYSMGLLSSAMEVQENASKYRSLNAELIKVALRRLYELKEKMIASRQLESTNVTTTNTPEPSSPGPFAGIDLNDDTSRSTDSRQTEGIIYRNSEEQFDNFIGLGGCTQPMRVKSRQNNENGDSSPPRKKIKTNTSFGSLQDLENSNSCWSKLQPYVIGKHKIYPLTIEMHQRLILQFLGPTGEYQDLLAYALEGNSLDLILYYIDLENTKDVRFTFDALRYLTSLLVHRKFALEFIAKGGVQLLLKIPRLCMASVGAITCFYYLSYNEEVMEKVCQLDGLILDDLVDYALWCLEHSYESGMASASMFFTHSFYYKAILSRFDQQDGLRRLYNYISTLAVLINSTVIEHLSDEMVHTSIQSVRNASASFRSYVSAHIYQKLEQMKKHCKGLIQYLKMPTETLVPHKVMEMSDDSLELAVELLTSLLKLTPSGWKPIENARQLGLLNTMFNLLEFIHSWSSVRKVEGKNEMLRNALEVIWLCSPLGKVREDFTKIIHNSPSHYNGFRLLTMIAGGALYEDEFLQQHALKTILNSVQNTHIYKGSFRLDSKRVRTDISEISETEKPIWECLRRNNIFMILNNVIRQKTPVTEADRLHELGCRTLLGLARSEDVRQTLSKLPLLANNELQGLMQMPVAQDKKLDHTKFCRSSKELIEIVMQRSINDKIPDPKDLTQERLWKSHVVANTKISYNEKELLQLIHGHLLAKGLDKTAAELTKEAKLPDIPASCVITPAKIEPLPNAHSIYGTSAQPTTSSASLYNKSPPKTPFPRTPLSKRLILRPPNTPRATFNHGPSKKIQPIKGLDGIVTDYFRQQHSHCSKPVTVCPPFSLFFPHNCPEPISIGAIPYNMVKRFAERPIRRDLGRSLFQDEKYAFSRFRTLRNFSEQEECYTCCTFSVDDEHLIVGMFNGDVFWINIETGNEDSHTVCHHSGLTHLEAAKDGSMLLTSSQYVRPLSALWKLRETQEHCYDFQSERRVKFSNLTLDKIVGTHDETGKATVFDTETGRVVSMYEYKREIYGSRVRYNTASFSPEDTMIINDGVLWDIRDSTRPIHVFDKLSDFNGEIFHPHGNEVIINSAVWDARNYRLVHTVPVLDSCEIKFNSTGNVLYASGYVEEDNYRLYTSAFKTIDAKDYSVITTIDTKRPLLDFACSHGDQFVALIERKTQNTELPFSSEHSAVKILEVGKKRDAEDDLDEAEEDNDDNRGDDEDSISSGSTINSFDDDEIMDALNFDGSSDTTSMTDEEDDDDEEADLRSPSDDEGSEGWETASGEDLNEIEENDIASSRSHSEEEGEHDNADNEPPDNADRHPSTSTVALNPIIRRQKRRRDSGGNN